MPTGTPSDLPTATLSYAAADTQWTLPPWIRTGLLVGVWLTFTAIVFHLGWTMWLLGGLASITDLFRPALIDPAHAGNALLLLLMPLAWIVSASALVARTYVIPLTVILGWMCVAYVLLHAAGSAYGNWVHWQTLPADEQTMAHISMICGEITSYLPLAAFGLLLLFARPRYRIAERVKQRFGRIVGGTTLVVLAAAIAVSIANADAYLDELDYLAKPWKTLMQLLWLSFVAAVIWLAVLIPMGLVQNRPVWTRAAQLTGALAVILLHQTILRNLDVFHLNSFGVGLPWSWTLSAVVDQLPTFIQDLTLAFALYAAGKLGTPIAQTSPPPPSAPELAGSDTPSGTEPTS